MPIRDINYLTGPETETIPTASTPSASNDFVTLGYLQANYASLARTVSGTRASPTAIVAANGIAFTGSQAFTTWFIQGSGGNVTISANPKIAAGSTVGQRLTLIVPSAASNSVTIQDTNGVEMNGVWVGAPGSAIEFEWDGTNWFELWRRSA